MELHNNYNSGFTLIEILVTLGIVAFVLGLSLNIGFDTYNRADFFAERDLLVQYLQGVRGKAIANIDNVEHGLRVETSDDVYVILEGFDEVYEIPMREGVTVTNIEGGDVTIMFRQNSGRSTGGTIILDDGTRSQEIEINQEGGIIW